MAGKKEKRMKGFLWKSLDIFSICESSLVKKLMKTDEMISRTMRNEANESYSIYIPGYIL